jgi:hypothetical protein
MPEAVGRSIGSGFASPAYPVVANNPAFKVEIIPLDNRLEQSNNAKSNAGELEEIKVGENIRGEIMHGTKSKGKSVEGKVVSIDQDGETVLAFRVVTKDGEEVNIDPTTASKVDGHPEDFAQQDEPGNTYENRILSYSQWLAESRK